MLKNTLLGNCHPDISQEPNTYSLYDTDSELRVVASESGMYICQACPDDFNGGKCVFGSVPFFLTDVNRGFAVEGPKKVEQGQYFKLKCSASVYEYIKDTIR